MAETITPQGTPIHFVRPQETGCRPGKLLSDSVEETVSFPTRGLFEFGHFTYGDPPGSDSKHSFQASRKRDPVGHVDTWHRASECPFKEVPKTREAPRAREPQVP